MQRPRSNGPRAKRPKVWHCLRCGHYWTANDPNATPIRCAHCKSAYFRIPRTEKPELPGDPLQEKVETP